MAFDFSQAQSFLVQGGTIFGLFLLGLVFVAIIVGIVYLQQQKKAYSKYKVLVWQRFKDKDGNEIPTIVKWDKARIMFDRKLKKWKFHIKGLDVDLGEEEAKSIDEDRDLDIPKIPFEDGGYVVFVERLGTRKYAIGKPFIIEGTVKVIVSQADLAEGIRCYDLHTRTFGKKENQLMIFGIYVTFAALILILIIVILNKFEMIKEAASLLNSATGNIAAAKGNIAASTAPG